MKIDTEIRHVTKPEANLFMELGFDAEEAERLQEVSRKHINDTRPAQGTIDDGASDVDLAASPQAG